MSTKYPAGSMGEQEQKNTKTFSIIAIAGFFLFHLGAVVLSHNLLVNMHKYPLLWALPVLAIAALALSIYGRVAEKDWAEESKNIYIALIVLAFASAVAIGYCPSC